MRNRAHILFRVRLVAGQPAEIKFMISGLLVIFRSYCGLLLKNYLWHGASGISRHKKRPSSVEDAYQFLIGSKARCFRFG